VTAAPKPETIREPLYLAWLHWQPCVICQRYGLRQETSSDAAHTPRVRIHGDIALPLCRCHHNEEERLQPTVFWGKYQMDPLAIYGRLHVQFETDLMIAF
jgi:hypothetical protein